MRSPSCVTFIAAMCAAAVVHATPETITYQGTLVDADGVPLPDGLYNLTIRLGETPVTGDEFVWMESYVDVPLVKGQFTVILGEDPNNSLFNVVTLADFLFLEVILNPKDGTDALVFEPRILVTSAPYALRAATLDGHSLDGILGMFRGLGAGSAISGGDDNSAIGVHATVGGGVGNSAAGEDATVGGGDGNSAAGEESTVSERPKPEVEWEVIACDL